MEVMKGLGPLIRGQADVIQRILQFWEANLNPTDIGLLLAILDFCASVGLGAGDRRVDMWLTILDKARRQDGRLPGLPDYFEVLAAHVKWSLRVDTRR